MSEMFLKFEGVDGESQDTAGPVKHAGEIEIKSWGWGSKAIVKWDQNQGGQSIHAGYECIKVEKYVDKASSMLLRCCLTGKHIKSARITCRKNDGDQKVEYLILDLTDVMLSEVRWTGAGEDTQISESINLEFAEFYMQYKLQQDEGEAAGGTNFGFNVQTQHKQS